MPSTRSRRTSTPKKRKKRGLTARTSDRHELYQASVQAPAHEIKLLTRLFVQHSGRAPLHLREDFCGTALLCAEWIKSKRGRTAIGLDIDEDVLAWGSARHLAPLGEDAARVSLRAQDVCVPTKERPEIIVGFNYSYSIFKTRDALRAYFRAAHRSLANDGLFVIDAIGGWEAQSPLVERRQQRGFVYVWEQVGYCPITADFLAHIHFEFPDGTKLRRAFTYDWRLWTLPELRELLLEAGFVGVDALWESADAEGEGTGIFRRVTKAKNDPGWNAYLVAKKRG